MTQLGLTPNTTIRLLDFTPLGNTVTFASDTEMHILSTQVANKVMLTPL